MEAGWYELETESVVGLRGGALLAAAAVAMVYVGFVAAVAGRTGAFYIMFPELGALAYDVFGRPRGHWSNAPIHLATTPVITGVIGILITRILPYGFFSVLLDVGGALAVILALDSPIAPAISAGLLPLVLGIKSWGYPPGIMFGTVVLAAASLPWRRLMVGRLYRNRVPSSAPTTPRGWFWAMAYFAFLIAAVAMVRSTGLRFILFPPLAVIGFEMFGHTESCAWAGQPFRLPIVCLLTAAGGLAFHHLLGVNWMTAALSMAWGMTMLQLFRVHVPPALAVALLPMVMDAPTWRYPCSVGVGTLALTLWFWMCRGQLLQAQKNNARAAARRIRVAGRDRLQHAVEK
jgi:HPP family